MQLAPHTPSLWYILWKHWLYSSFETPCRQDFRVQASCLHFSFFPFVHRMLEIGTEHHNYCSSHCCSPPIPLAWLQQEPQRPQDLRIHLRLLIVRLPLAPLQRHSLGTLKEVPKPFNMSASGAAPDTAIAAWAMEEWGTACLELIVDRKTASRRLRSMLLLLRKTPPHHHTPKCSFGTVRLNNIHCISQHHTAITDMHCPRPLWLQQPLVPRYHGIVLYLQKNFLSLPSFVTAKNVSPDFAPLLCAPTHLPFVDRMVWLRLGTEFSV